MRTVTAISAEGKNFMDFVTKWSVSESLTLYIRVIVMTVSTGI